MADFPKQNGLRFHRSELVPDPAAVGRDEVEMRVAAAVAAEGAYVDAVHALAQATDPDGLARFGRRRELPGLL